VSPAARAERGDLGPSGGKVVAAIDTLNVTRAVLPVMRDLRDVVLDLESGNQPLQRRGHGFAALIR